MAQPHIQDDWASIEFEEGLPQLRELDERGETLFKHERLEKGDYFRLVQLCSKPVLGKHIHCRIHHFRLDSAPPYRAVSYVWGDPAPTGVIYVGDLPYREMEVSENLDALLCHVLDESDCWLWIDALCIDQSSKSERNHQVSLMGQIYANANIVLGWLGPGNHDIHRAFHFISEAASEGALAHCRSKHDSDEPVELENPSIAALPMWQYDWCSVAHFAQLEYWKRRWIIQEVVLAKSVVLQAGQKKLAMDDVERFFKRFDEDFNWRVDRRRIWDQFMRKLLPKRHDPMPQLERSSNSDSTEMFSGLPLARIAHHRIERESKRKHTAKLRELMHRYESCICKEPSDTVYALYNLLGEHRQFLEVDYAQTPARRCVSVLKFLRDHEDMKEFETVRFTSFLFDLLCQGVEQRSLHSPELRDLSNETPFTTMFFDLGLAKKRKDTSRVLRLRERTPALRSMPTYMLQHDESRWTVKPFLDQRGECPIPGTNVVNPNDLVCFSVGCPDTFYGLATCPIKDGDHVWHSKTMEMAFIMRPSLDGSLFEVAGRARIFDTFIGTIRQLDYAGEQAIYLRSSSREQTILIVQEVVLTAAELLELAFWASGGPENSPFDM